MIVLDRRAFGLAALSVLTTNRAGAQTAATDSAGRALRLPAKINRVLAAGGPAAVALYVMRPDAMLGWPRANRDEEKPYLLPGVRDLPEIGILTGRGDTANVELVLRLQPDLILDYGSVRGTFVSLANTTEERTGIPYALVDGRLEAIAGSFGLLGNLLGVPERGALLASYTEDLLKRLDATLAAVPEDQRPRVYLARGADGLETGLKGSINTEIIERAGGRNVADPQDQRRGIATVSMEQLLLWNPDIVVTWDRNFHRKLMTAPDPAWQSLKAVENKRVYLAPTAPFGWIDRPPSVNRLIGLPWLANIFHGDKFPFDIRRETRSFYKLFYHVEVADADLETLIAWADGTPPTLPPKR